jgi:endonuclease YncB( thermonuclease family)
MPEKTFMKRSFITGIVVLVVCASAVSVRAAEPWRTLKDCRLVPNPSNDGDSFHVHANGEEYVFRLYYVDTPETDLSFKDRVQEQANYFGLSIEDTLSLGQRAAVFTERQLRSHPFAVVTCWQDAQGRSRLERYYAFVVVDDKDLSEELVRQGLARVYGMKVTKPDGTKTRAEEEKLLALEREAKEAHRGGWGKATDTPASESSSSNALPRIAPLPTVPLHNAH